MQAVQSAVAPIRALTWQSSVPVEIRLAQGDGEPSAGGGIERYYLQAPRYSFLPLLLKEIRENFVELAIHEEDLVSYKEADWWFEEDLKDLSTDQERLSANVGREEASREPCRWHWPIDLIHLHSQIRRPVNLHGTSTASTTPLRLILHLTPPPSNVKDKLILSSTTDALKSQYMTSLKEADFVRWGHTRRITGLKRMDLEGGWRSIVEGDYDAHSRFASKILPLPFPPSAPESQASTATSSVSQAPPSRPASTDPSGIGSSALSSVSGKPDSVYATRAIPLRLYLPEGAPVIQEVIPPLNSEGKPTTVIEFLRQHLPLLFPVNPPRKPSHSSTRQDTTGETDSYPLAVAILQGVILPPEAELGWLSSCACGPDGWLRMGVQLRADS